MRELLPTLAAGNVFDACHPGWPCHRTITAVDEVGNIYFGCDRFMAGGLHGSRDFVIGHADEGFRAAFGSDHYAICLEPTLRALQGWQPFGTTSLSSRAMN
ncbi:hypothetical protein [Rhodovulum sulfidophilum]|uniref:hypothetical protein n=1 Tax=Rhodovulum sulfidophilum TaxID=35806 RepID=UPI002224A52A|nr:hypothetical protein [Rhodovulum sulfidophilum]